MSSSSSEPELTLSTENAEDKTACFVNVVEKSSPDSESTEVKTPTVILSTPAANFRLTSTEKGKSSASQLQNSVIDENSDVEALTISFTDDSEKDAKIRDSETSNAKQLSAPLSPNEKNFSVSRTFSNLSATSPGKIGCAKSTMPSDENYFAKIQSFESAAPDSETQRKDSWDHASQPRNICALKPDCLPHTSTNKPDVELLTCTSSEVQDSDNFTSYTRFKDIDPQKITQTASKDSNTQRTIVTSTYEDFDQQKRSTPSTCQNSDLKKASSAFKDSDLQKLRYRDSDLQKPTLSAKCKDSDLKKHIFLSPYKHADQQKPIFPTTCRDTDRKNPSSFSASKDSGLQKPTPQSSNEDLDLEEQNTSSTDENSDQGKPMSLSASKDSSLQKPTSTPASIDSDPQKPTSPSTYGNSDLELLTTSPTHKDTDLQKQSFPVVHNDTDLKKPTSSSTDSDQLNPMSLPKYPSLQAPMTPTAFGYANLPKLTSLASSSEQYRENLNAPITDSDSHLEKLSFETASNHTKLGNLSRTTGCKSRIESDPITGTNVRGMYYINKERSSSEEKQATMSPTSSPSSKESTLFASDEGSSDGEYDRLLMDFNQRYTKRRRSPYYSRSSSSDDLQSPYLSTVFECSTSKCKEAINDMHEDIIPVVSEDRTLNYQSEINVPCSEVSNAQFQDIEIETSNSPLLEMKRDAVNVLTEWKRQNQENSGQVIQHRSEEINFMRPDDEDEKMSMPLFQESNDCVEVESIALNVTIEIKEEPDDKSITECAAFEDAADVSETLEISKKQGKRKMRSSPETVDVKGKKQKLLN